MNPKKADEVSGEGKIMNEAVKGILARVQQAALFDEVDFSDINACAIDGDNALHVVVLWGDLAAASALLDAGIEVNKAGDLGYTPLHVACMEGNLEMVKLLVQRGADLFSMSEGYAPFTSARLAGADHICDYLGPLMEKASSEDSKIWLRSRIAQLRREADRLEAQLKDS